MAANTQLLLMKMMMLMMVMMGGMIKNEITVIF